MKPVSITALRDRKAPPEYLGDVLAAAYKIVGEFALLSDDAYAALIHKYRVVTVPRQSGSSVAVPEGPVPRDQWPQVIEDMAALAMTGDAGVGDVYARNPLLWYGQVKPVCNVCDSKIAGCLNRRYPLR